MTLKQDIRKKRNYYILIGLSLIFIVVSLVVGIWYYQKINRENVSNTLKYNETIIKLTQNRIDSEFNEVHYIDYYIEINDLVQKKLKGSQLSEQDRVDIRQQLYRLKASMKLLDDICIYLEKEDIIISSRNITTPEIYFETQCKLTDYTYENWKNEYLLRPRYREFYPMQTIKLADTFNQNVIIYKRTLFSSLSASDRIHILMTIRTEGIEKLVNTIGNNIDNSIIIADNRGDIVYTTDKNAAAINTESIYRDTGRLISQEGDYVVYKKSDNLNLIYSIRMKKNSVLDNSDLLMRIGILLIVLYLLLVIGYLYLSVRLSYQPIKIIMNKIGNKEFMPDDNGSELDFITTKIDRLLENENIYADQMERIDRYEKNRTIKDLLLGNEAAREAQDIEWEHELFLTSVMRVMSMEDFKNDEGQFVKYTVLSMLKEFFHQFGKCEIIELGKNDIVAVFNFEESQYETLIAKIQESIDIVSNIIEAKIDATLIAAISGTYKGEKKLALCYKEARAAIDFRSINDEENLNVIQYDRISDTDAAQNTWYYWPSEWKNILHEYVNRGDYDSIESAIDEIVQLNIKKPKDVATLGECLYYNIFGALLDISSEYIRTYSMIEDISKYNKEIQFKENIDILKDRFKTLCNITASRNTGDMKLLHRIEEYIDEHFTENSLDLAEIADHAQISVRYLTSYFKKHKNTTLLKYITNKRIAYAKSLLMNTTATINTIAIRSGYTDARVFAKIFKKNEGMTPNQYRDTLNNE